ncbi:hypothetical protein EON68_02155 [archaeon]|nr:MAG: hypothetical protein EON68_02155 [archaeon]
MALSRATLAALRRTPCLPRGGRTIHACAAALSAKNPGPVEQAFREEFGKFSPPSAIDASVVRPAPAGAKAYSAKISRLAEELSGLTLLETMDLTDLMKEKLGMQDSYVGTALPPRSLRARACARVCVCVCACVRVCVGARVCCPGGGQCAATPPAACTWCPSPVARCPFSRRTSSLLPRTVCACVQ